MEKSLSLFAIIQNFNPIRLNVNTYNTKLQHFKLKKSVVYNTTLSLIKPYFCL